MKDKTARWDLDPSTTPDPPWNEWSTYAGCWTCRECGAAAGWLVHNPRCRAKEE